MHSDVVIIGAGPYGLSVAAHLAARGADFRIFGTPMRTWRTQILRDSHLKSEGFASSLYEPSGRFTLAAYCREKGLPYQDIGLPVRRAIFADYGLAFQERFVPMLEKRDIAALRRTPEGFALTTEDGEALTARRVVVAVGISRFAYTPPLLASLPAECASHSSDRFVVDDLARRDVIVVGAGASALDVAKELIAVGATVRLVARAKQIEFHDPPHQRSFLDKITQPMSGLGPGWKSRLCTDAPLVFRLLPEATRVRVVKRHLGPAPCWFTRDPVDGQMEFLMERDLRSAEVVGGRVHLGLTRADGSAEELVTDHVIAATGYRVDLARIGFLPADIRESLRLCETSPALSPNFESSVPGLYFVGLAAANTFGPVSRFAFGARFTAPRLSAHLLRTASSAAPRPAPEGKTAADRVLSKAA
ncbi:MAG: NAD(P)/FAD-dependent oxidoreductase [Proteobacteria bacterium]|nr:NAD(P)/FAD-dependent oxidoreductase [Pseudomonadota bacterium]